MSGTFIIILAMVLAVILGKVIIIEGQRIKQHKKFIKNMEEHDKKYKYKTK